MRDLLEQEDIIPELLGRIKGKLGNAVDDLPSATPAQSMKMCSACITALAHAGHRSQSESSGKAVQKALTLLIRQVQNQIEDTDPGDCAALLEACAALEFQSITTAALQQRNQLTN